MGNRFCPCGGSVGVHRVSERGVIQLEGSLCGEKEEKNLEFYPVVYFLDGMEGKEQVSFQGKGVKYTETQKFFYLYLVELGQGVYWRGVLFTLRFFGVASGHLREGKGAFFLCSRFEADLYTSCMLGGLFPLIYLCLSIKK